MNFNLLLVFFLSSVVWFNVDAEEISQPRVPGKAIISHMPAIPVKRKSVTLKCDVEDSGNPTATSYRWLKNSELIHDLATSTWTIEPIKLDDRANFSCYAYNEIGNGEAATIDLEIHVRPTFIRMLHPYSGALFSTLTFELTCHVECFPTCTIDWFKDGDIIDDETNDYYQIVSTNLSAQPRTDDFESVLSILHFNISAWPNQKFDIFKDNGNYSCVSSSNSIGPGVRSTTYLGIEFPPRNVTTTKMIKIEEGDDKLQIISCTSKAVPNALYDWYKKDEAKIAKGNSLILEKLNRTSAGEYVCVAYNKHGLSTDSLFVNVTYKPTCTIKQTKIDNKDVLLCTAADGNPPVYDFDWDAGDGMVSEDDVTSNNNHSILTLDVNDIDVIDTYSCYAYNTIGGSVCTINVEVFQLNNKI